MLGVPLMSEILLENKNATVKKDFPKAKKQAVDFI